MKSLDIISPVLLEATTEPFHAALDAAADLATADAVRFIDVLDVSADRAGAILAGTADVILPQLRFT